MNFLGHIYLSGNDLHIQLGNLMADGLRSKDFEKYPERVQLGIALHHKIDAYTDAHPAVKEAVELLKQKQGRYASVLIDIFIDHYLALHWQQYHSIPLSLFAQDFYAKTKKLDFELPKHTAHMLFYMEKYNWLEAYAYQEGLIQVMQGMSRRANFKNKIAESVAHFWKDREIYYALFERFLGDIEKFLNE
jgi:acyl carrier protein phosphodiesterase